MKHRQRIMAIVDVDPRQRPPGSTNKIKRLSPANAGPAGLFQNPFHPACETAFAAQFLEAKNPQGEGYVLVNPPSCDPHELQAAAAQVAGS